MEKFNRVRRVLENFKLLGKNPRFFVGRPGLSALCLVATIGILLESCNRTRSNQSGPASSPATTAPVRESKHPKQNPSTTAVHADDESFLLSTNLRPIFQLLIDQKSGPARVRLKNFLDQHPNDGQASFLFGLSYHREKKYAQATPYFLQALQQAPEFAPTNHFLGWAYFYQGDLPSARTAFEAFLRVKRDEPDSLFGLGLIDLEEDKLDDAQQHFLQSIEIRSAQRMNPDFKALSKAHTRLAEVYERRDELERARSELKTATEMYPDNYEGLYKLYRVLTRLGKSADAERARQKFLAAKDRLHPGTSFPE